jgi:hypothetical protein
LKDLRIIGSGNFTPTIGVINQSDFINVAKLVGGIRQNFNAPNEASIVMFSSTSDFYCLIGPSVTASISVGSILDGSASEFNPIAREILPRDKISLISVVDCRITMAFYR